MTAWMLDTALLAIPNYGIDRRSAEEIIERTFQISALVAAEVPITFAQSDTAQTTLWEGSCGPDYANIIEFLVLVDLVGVFSTNDVLRSYNTIFERCPLISDLGPVVEGFVLTSLSPDPISGQTPTDLANESRRCIATTGVNVVAKRLAGLAPGWRDDGSDEITASHEIASYACATTHEPLGQQSQVIPLLIRPIYLARHKMSGRIWREAATARDLHLSILVRAIELQQALGRAESDLKINPFHVGTEFHQSLGATQASGSQPFSELCLDVCAQLVAGVCNRYQRPMGADGQIFRATDSAAAMRVHLTDSHEALRLMYWKTGEVIEFANVGPKFQLVIKDGVMGLGTVIEPSLLTS